MVLIYITTFFYNLLFLLSIISPDSVSGQISPDEIKSVSSQIWRFDDARLSTEDVVYNVTAPRLFTYVNESKLNGTYALLRKLFRHYEPRIGIKESSNREKKQAQENFLVAILKTRPIIKLHKWLVSRDLANNDKAEFKEDLRKYWFTGYSRIKGSGVVDSSGFEHVFIGEIYNKKKRVIGFHNWLFAYEEENATSFVYQNLTRTCENEVIAVNFTWWGSKKPNSSLMIRTSPEVELSLFTLCFLTTPGGSCEVNLAGHDHNITTFIMPDNTTNGLVASAYVNCLRGR